MPISSSPVASGTNVDGSEYNSLRQDVLQNHVHDGSAGPRIDHDDLKEAGLAMGANFYDHTAIDAHIDATTGVHGNVLYGHTANLLIQYGLTDPGWSGSGWFYYDITFPTAFASTPNVVATPHQVSGVDAVILVVTSVSSTGFRVEGKGVEPNHDTGANDDLIDTYVSWMAIGPRA